MLGRAPGTPGRVCASADGRHFPDRITRADANLENVELGGHVHAINPGTGQREYPCLISVAVDRASYNSLNLRDEDAPPWVEKAIQECGEYVALADEYHEEIGLMHEEWLKEQQSASGR